MYQLNQEFERGEDSLLDYAAGMNAVSGREHLMQSLWNVMDAIGKIAQPILEAFQDMFPPADGKRIYVL